MSTVTYSIAAALLLGLCSPLHATDEKLVIEKTFAEVCPVYMCMNNGTHFIYYALDFNCQNPSILSSPNPISPLGCPCFRMERSKFREDALPVDISSPNQCADRQSSTSLTARHGLGRGVLPRRFGKYNVELQKADGNLQMRHVWLHEVEINPQAFNPRPNCDTSALQSAELHIAEEWWGPVSPNAQVKTFGEITEVKKDKDVDHAFRISTKDQSGKVRTFSLRARCP